MTVRVSLSFSLERTDRREGGVTTRSYFRVQSIRRGPNPNHSSTVFCERSVSESPEAVSSDVWAYTSLPTNVFRDDLTNSCGGLRSPVEGILFS